jgi:DNA-binding NarL/FixJ family response regulator
MAARRRTVEQVRVLIVDDQETFLRAMRALIDASLGLVVVGEPDLVSSPWRYQRTGPELVLMDVHLAGMDGIEATCCAP